ncbi:uncharacterized protein LOC62_04G005429 [Vanrija pseudolonga]|uniref:Uncharacterized protein n=1 Tax=Vanrija pseudolonga TaxID=143232 RepID=A0AAF1BMC8_9TREE|nr:hypothetical protein LOC62_04G005429 [Vanrija pseudolonga]
MEPPSSFATDAMDALTLNPNSTPASPVPVSENDGSAPGPSTHGQPETTPCPCAGIDHTAFPEIVERIFEFADPTALAGVRCTSKGHQRFVEALLYRHVQVRPWAPTLNAEGDLVSFDNGYALTSVRATLIPGLRWTPDAPDEKEATRIRLQRHTEIVDLCRIYHRPPRDSTLGEDNALLTARQVDLNSLVACLRNATTVRHLPYDREAIIPEIRSMNATTMITFTSFQDLVHGDSWHKMTYKHPPQVRTSIMTVLHDYTVSGPYNARRLGEVLRFQQRAEDNRAFIFFAPPMGSWSEGHSSPQYNLAFDIAKLVVHQAVAMRNRANPNYALFVAGLDVLPAPLVRVPADLDWDNRKAVLLYNIRDLIRDVIDTLLPDQTTPLDEDVNSKFEELKLISLDEFRQAVGDEHYRLSHPGDDIVLSHGVSIRSNVPIKGFIYNGDHPDTLLQITSPETHKTLPGLSWNGPFGTDREAMEDTTLRNIRKYTKIVDLEEGGAWKYVNHDEYAELQSALAGVTAIRARHWSDKSRALLQSASLSAKVLFDCGKLKTRWRWKDMSPETPRTIIVASGGDFWCIFEDWKRGYSKPSPDNELYIVITAEDHSAARPPERNFILGLEGFAEQLMVVQRYHEYRVSIVGLDTLGPEDLGMSFAADTPWLKKKAMIYKAVKKSLGTPGNFYKPPDNVEDLNSTVDSIRFLSRNEFKEEVGEALNSRTGTEPPRQNAPTDPGYWIM